MCECWRRAANWIPRRKRSTLTIGVNAAVTLQQFVVHGDQLSVRARIAGTSVLNWATLAADGTGGALVERNPLKGLPLPIRANGGHSPNRQH